MKSFLYKFKILIIILILLSLITTFYKYIIEKNYDRFESESDSSINFNNKEF